MDRRKFLQASLLTLGAAAPGLSYWLGGVRDGIAPIFPRAKSVVVLFMSGGPSQIELFDYKEALERMDGKTISGFENESANALPSPLLAPVITITFLSKIPFIIIETIAFFICFSSVFFVIFSNIL